ncbi:hypothetical protein IAR55_004149 [Kwoniella newhampshirensis]|uniref:G-patch domain-containing protein n=1 Tax=Kwoniella newhampshirensis TaxID=1651941 RepID=A0AAW0YMS3_9TREE
MGASSDSEDDFMSDKFLVDAAASSSSSTKTKEMSYSARRSAQALKGMRAGQAKNQIKLKELEEIQRRKGLETSLFEGIQTQAVGTAAVPGDGRGSNSSAAAATTTTMTTGGGNKAVEMMMKMGWKMGEGLGKKRSPSPPSSSKRAKLNLVEDDEDDEDSTSRGGLGLSSSSRLKTGSKPSFIPTSSSTDTQPKAQPRTEPIRISMWSGRAGLTARPPSPPPLRQPSSRRDPDALDPEKMERLGKETEGFRERQRREFGEKERERKGWKARERLREFDVEKGVKFHPLHVLPSDPLGTIPRPLLRLIYPSQVLSPSPPRSLSPDPILSHGKQENLSAAEKMREQIRRDMLTDLGDGGDDSEDEDGVVRFGTGISAERKHDDMEERQGKTGDGETETYEGVNWEDMVSGVKRVLAMDPATYLTFVVDQLRNEYLFCFWCAYKYRSFEEMDEPGGCPGEEEDDH